MNLFYKNCAEKDLQDLVEISIKTFVSAFEKQNDPEDFKTYIHKAFSKEQLEKELLDPDVRFYFVYKENNLVGYYKLNSKNAQTEPLGDDSIEIERIYVLDEYQGQNIGMDMLLKIIDIAKNEKNIFLWLGVWEKNTSAIRFYERYGFIKFGTHPYIIGNDIQTDWLMRLNLV